MQRPAGPHTQVNTQSPIAAANSNHSEEQIPTEDPDTFQFNHYGDLEVRRGEEIGFGQIPGDDPEDDPLQGDEVRHDVVDENYEQPDRDAEGVMVRTELSDERNGYNTRRAARLASEGS